MQSNAQQSLEIKSSKEPHVKQDDFYYETVDHDGDYDGFIHIISTVDGSELKLEIRKLLQDLKIPYEK